MYQKFMESSFGGSWNPSSAEGAGWSDKLGEFVGLVISLSVGAT